MRPAAPPRGAEPPAGVPVIAGGSPEADAPDVSPSAGPPGTRCLAILVPAAALSAATVFFGVIPSPLVDWASNAGQALAAFIP
jgi:hypothetical protein